MRKLVLMIWAAAGLAGAAEFRAGVAKVDLQPPVGLPMAGYDLRFARGTLDPVEARVLAVSDGTKTLALVTLDLCFPFEPRTMETIRAGARGAADEVVFHASHTHSGPTYAAAPQAEEQAAPRVVSAIRAAVAAMVPARIGTGWGETFLGFNRRYVRADGATQMFWRNETKVSTTYPVDPTVGVIRVDRQDGTPLAVLVNYACHPVVLGPENLEYSADYPGEMRRAVEEQMTGAMAFFLQGAPGDINPYYDKTPLIEDAVARMKQTGRQLAAEAVRVARTIATRAPATPEIDSKTVVLAVANRWNVQKLVPIVEKQYGEEAKYFKRLMAASMQVPVTTVVLNRELAFVGMPGEPFVEFQMQLRAKSPLRDSFLLGYTNDYFAYFPTIAAAVRGGYGANSMVVPTEVGTGERMLNTGLISIYELLGELKARPETAQ